MADFETRRLAERYADDADFKAQVDDALGVFHVPRHQAGECAGCDRQRLKEAQGWGEVDGADVGYENDEATP